MRIITGRYKGRNLFMVPGATTRPTTAFNREVIFSTHQDYAGARVLDLFAGTGSLGLEALSRGAEWVDFVEFSSIAISVLLKNIKLLGCAEQCHIFRKRVEVFLSEPRAPYDIIFLDPPYHKNLIAPVLTAIFEQKLLLPDGILIAEHSPKEAVPEALKPYLFKEKGSKTSAFSFFCLPEIDQD
ncbi:MAG: 16S rRNA (guanine(966)-N(2))-methyltransferase RsmD [Candidatus Cloacimonadaceae bacterium]|nr:16S rRNA (guanine(966)-N(2))-methyltransferase RsmD [Candidatus Cloacimonadaceae bacterium]